MMSRAIPADAEERAIAQPVSTAQMFLDIDPRRFPDTPLVVKSQTGKVLATFALAGDLARFVSEDRKSLPAAFVRRVAGQ